MNLKLSLIVNPKTNSKVWDRLRCVDNEYIHEYWFNDDPTWTEYGGKYLQFCKNPVPAFKDELLRYKNF